MANKTIEILMSSGISGALLMLFDRGADTLLNPTGGGDVLTERTNAKGVYTATVAEAITGNKRAVVTLADGITALWVGRVYIQTDTVTTYYAVDEDASDSTALIRADMLALFSDVSAAGFLASMMADGTINATLNGNVKGIEVGGITTASFVAGTTIPRVTLVDTATTLTEEISVSGGNVTITEQDINISDS